MTYNNKIAVIGAGHIGRLLTRYLVAGGYEVTLFNRAGSKNEETIIKDIDKLKSESLDNPSWGKVNLTFDLQEVKGNRIINYVAGAPRGKDEERSALFHKNAKIVDNYITILAKNNPDAMIVNAANPLDLLTRSMYEAINNQGFNNPVIGMGSSLDTKRLHEVIKETSNHRDAVIENAYMLGEHGPTMVAVLSEAKIDGKPFNEVFTAEEIEDITFRTRDRGRQIIIETEHSDVKGPADRLYEITEVVTKEKESYIPLLFNARRWCI